MACRSAQIIFLLINIGIYITGCTQTSSQTKNFSQFQDGDIILRKGRGIISSLITASINDSLPYSHCGILVRENQEWKVIHSLARELSKANGIQQCSLNDFIVDCDDSCLMVVRCKMSNANSLMADAARYYLKQRIPFDYKFSMADSSAFFCSELPLHILKYRCNITFDFKDKYIPFSVFTDSTYFKVIQKIY